MVRDDNTLRPQHFRIYVIIKLVHPALHGFDFQGSMIFHTNVDTPFHNQSLIKLLWVRLLVRMKVIEMNKLWTFQLLEMFGAGTAVVISPISKVGFLERDISIPTMKQAQPVFQRVKDTLLAIQYGHIEHPYAKVIS